MFDAIAPRYDLLNHVLSAGIYRRWGTSQAAHAARVIGVDFAPAMLAFGHRKVRDAQEGSRIALVRGDAANLPVRDGRVDAVTVAFGIRNVERPERACAEMARALRRGGRLAILEFGVPRLPGISTLYLWYFKYLLPRVGRIVSGHTAAYSYLPASVGAFPPPAAFMAMLEQAGFTHVRADSLTLGIVYLYTAEKR
jgi:demethylmenaquinone methyltransferase/2-methoxy-6-polyprenyl-1,4-benzoquinol methylase